jgi:hypothetical protein
MTSLIDSNILIQTEDSNLLRDGHSKALLNKNIAALNEYKARKKFFDKTKHEEIDTKERLQKLEQDMSDIKKLLIEIAQMRASNGN